MIKLALLLFGAYVSLYLHILIHEAGHLVCGLISGYEFYSFRIGSIMWLRDPQTGKMQRKKLTIAGTGGQCLMSPPDLKDGRVLVILYLLGGVLANLLASLILLPFCFISTVPSGLAAFCKLMVVMGSLTAVTNGIPLHLSGIDNDGRNAWAMYQDSSLIPYFWVQLKANQQMAQGVRLRDMPAEWFAMPEPEKMNQGIVAAIGVFCCNRLMDEQRLDEAEQEMERLLRMKSAMAGIHRGLLVCDLIYCKLLRKESVETIHGWLNDSQKKFMKTMKNFPSVIRTQYAYALLGEKDEEKALQWLKNFEQVAKTYPYASDIESERELLVMAAESNSSYGYCVE